MNHIDLNSADEGSKDLAECPFCGAINESCKHLVVCFGVSVDAIEAGILVDHLDEINALMTGRSDGNAESRESDKNIEELVATVRAFLEQHTEVEWIEYSIDKTNGIWDYANYWARYPGMVIDDLYRHLEAASLDY